MSSENGLFGKYNQYVCQIAGSYDIRFNDVVELINNFQKELDIVGNICEVGIKEGKSFIPLFLCRKQNEIGIAVDNSGKSKDIFLENINIILDQNKNVTKFLTIYTGDSNQLDSETFLNVNNLTYRIFSINGFQSVSSLLHNLNNAVNLMNEGGVIIISDYNNKRRPGIRFAVDTFLQTTQSFIPVCLLYNKLILCNQIYFFHYAKLLNNTPHYSGIKKIKSSMDRHYKAEMWLGVKKQLSG